MTMPTETSTPLQLLPNRPADPPRNLFPVGPHALTRSELEAGELLEARPDDIVHVALSDGRIIMANVVASSMTDWLSDDEAPVLIAITRRQTAVVILRRPDGAGVNEVSCEVEPMQGSRYAAVMARLGGGWHLVGDVADQVLAAYAGSST